MRDFAAIGLGPTRSRDLSTGHPRLLVAIAATLLAVMGMAGQSSAPAAEKLNARAKVKVGDRFIGTRKNAPYKELCEVLEVTRDNRLKVRWRSGAAWDEVVSKSRLEYCDTVADDEDLPVGTRLYWDLHENGLRLMEVAVLRVLDDGKIQIRAIDWVEGVTRDIERKFLIWDVRPATGQGDRGKGSDTESELRTWTDATGKHSIRAKFSGVSNGKVTLVKVDGNSIELSLSKLSEADRKYIEMLLSADEKKPVEAKK